MSNRAVLGTAGHVDHGKTSLIKALTGTDCDTHKEEKKRGITINLGFTSLSQEETTISIVDMPGHADFIKTMVAGASGIDHFLLVIDSESGIMPQTVEHLNVLKTMNVTSGVVTFTKADLVDEDIIELLMAEVEDLAEEFPFIEECKKVAVSSKTGEGIEELRTILFQLIKEGTSKKTGSLFRLYIDRMFTIKGAGTVVAGSVLGGHYTIGDTLYLNPSHGEVKVRAMEKHGEPTETASAGDRISLNITNIKKEQLSRGMQLCTQKMQPTLRADATLTLYPQSTLQSKQIHAILLIGTKEVQTKIYFIDQKTVQPGESVLVQMQFHEELFLQPGEPFIIRNSSDDRSLGGGNIIDPSPLHHIKKPERLIERMQKLASGDFTPKIDEILDYQSGAIALKEIADVLNISTEEFKNLLPLEECTLTLKEDNGITYAIDKNELKKWKNEIPILLEEHYNEDKYSQGATTSTVAQLLNISKGNGTRFLQNILQELSCKKIVEQREGCWYPMNATTMKKGSNEIKVIDDFVRQTKQNPPSLNTIIKRYPQIPQTEIKKIVGILKKRERLFEIEDRLLHLSVLNKYSKELYAHLEEAGEANFTTFRDYIGSGRTFASKIITHLEEKGCIKQNSDSNFITTEKGKEHYKELNI